MIKYGRYVFYLYVYLCMYIWTNSVPSNHLIHVINETIMQINRSVTTLCQRIRSSMVSIFFAILVIVLRLWATSECVSPDRSVGYFHSRRCLSLWLGKCLRDFISSSIAAPIYQFGSIYRRASYSHGLWIHKKKERALSVILRDTAFSLALQSHPYSYIGIVFGLFFHFCVNQSIVC